MSEEPESLILQILREMRAELASKADLDALRAELVSKAELEAALRIEIRHALLAR